MAVVKLSTAGLTNYAQYSSMLAGNAPFNPIPPSAYDLLETTTLTSSASSVTFSGLVAYSDYAHLQVRAVLRSNYAGSSDVLHAYVNGDTGNNYARHNLTGRGSQGDVISGSSTSQQYFGRPSIKGAGGVANSYMPLIFDLLDFSNTSKNSTARMIAGDAENSETVEMHSGLWLNTDAITSLTMTGAFGTALVTGSRLSIYGIKGA